MKQLTLLWIILLMLFAGSVSAAINPVEYARMQRAAPEQLVIEVLLVHTHREWFFSRTRTVSVTAQVVSTTRSARGLAEGDRITIEYTNFRPKPGWVGPRPLPVLKEGTICPAFLIWDDEEDQFIPAARGYSFDRQLPLK